MITYLHTYVRNVPLLDPMSASFTAQQTYVPSSSFIKFLMHRDGSSNVPPLYFLSDNETWIVFAVPLDTFIQCTYLGFPLTLQLMVCVLCLVQSLFIGRVSGKGFSKTFIRYQWSNRKPKNMPYPSMTKNQFRYSNKKGLTQQWNSVCIAVHHLKCFVKEIYNKMIKLEKKMKTFCSYSTNRN